MPVQGEKGLRSFLLNSALFPVQRWSLTDCLAMISPSPPQWRFSFFGWLGLFWRFFFLVMGQLQCVISLCSKETRSLKKY